MSSLGTTFSSTSRTTRFGSSKRGASESSASSFTLMNAFAGPMRRSRSKTIVLSTITLCAAMGLALKKFSGPERKSNSYAHTCRPISKIGCLAINLSAICFSCLLGLHLKLADNPLRFLHTFGSSAFVELQFVHSLCELVPLARLKCDGGLKRVAQFAAFSRQGIPHGGAHCELSSDIA